MTTMNLSVHAKERRKLVWGEGVGFKKVKFQPTQELALQKKQRPLIKDAFSPSSVEKNCMA